MADPELDKLTWRTTDDGWRTDKETDGSWYSIRKSGFLFAHTVVCDKSEDLTVQHEWACTAHRASSVADIVWSSHSVDDLKEAAAAHHTTVRLTALKAYLGRPRRRTGPLPA